MVLETLIGNVVARKRGKLYACFVDFRAAFDSIDRETLWWRLSQLGMSSRTVNILKATYENVSFVVRDQSGNVSAEVLESKSGVRQGCPLSGFLFSCFIDDLTEFLSRVETHPPSINGVDIVALLYADDVVILSQSPVGLQRALDKLAQYENERNLAVNISKTKVMVFSNGNVVSKKLKFFYKDQVLDIVKNFKYLGVNLASNCRWTYHNNVSITQAKRSLGAVTKALCKYPNMPVKNLNQIFNSMIQPILTYGGEIWGAQFDARKIDALGCRIAKIILGVGRNCCNSAALLEVGRMTTSSQVLKLMLNYFVKLKSDHRRPLQRGCLEFQMRTKVEYFWANRVEQLALEVGLQDFSELPFNRKTKAMIFKAVQQHCYSELMKDVAEKSSLTVFRQLNLYETGAKYLIYVNKEERRFLAQIRLGTFVWSAEKRRDGTRVCVLCSGAESGWHLLSDCQGLSDLRSSLLPELEFQSAKDILDSHDANLLKRVSEFVKEAFKKRGDL